MSLSSPAYYSSKKAFQTSCFRVLELRLLLHSSCFFYKSSALEARLGPDPSGPDSGLGWLGLDFLSLEDYHQLGQGWVLSPEALLSFLSCCFAGSLDSAIKSQVVSRLCFLPGLSLCASWWGASCQDPGENANFANRHPRTHTDVSNVGWASLGRGGEASVSEHEIANCSLASPLVVQGHSALPAGAGFQPSQGKAPVYSAEQAGSGSWI